jgi:hypothetical protein
MALTKEVWLSQIMEGFYPNDSFLQKLVNFDAFVENDKIHIASAGIDPKVLINNTTYPINVIGRDDEDRVIELDKFETENTIVRRPDAIEYSYDKLESVIRQHRNTLRKAVTMKATHAIAPQKNDTDTPVVATTGAETNGRKRLTFSDILTLKESFDNADIPLERRYLILHPKHVSDLLLEDLKLFKNLTNISEGEPAKFAGFGCFSCSAMPTYTLANNEYEKVAYNCVATNNFASVAFCADEVFKADGDIYMYAKYDDPQERATIVGFDKRSIVLPIRNKGIGAIVSASIN